MKSCRCDPSELFIVFQDIYYFTSVFVLQVLRDLLPASGLPEQNDANASVSDDRRLLGHSHLHLIPAHHAGLEQHRHSRPGELRTLTVFVCHRRKGFIGFRRRRSQKYKPSRQDPQVYDALLLTGMSSLMGRKRDEKKVQQNMFHINTVNSLFPHDLKDGLLRLQEVRNACCYGNNINMSATESEPKRPLTRETCSQIIKL